MWSFCTSFCHLNCPQEELFGWDDSWQLSNADFVAPENEDDDEEEDDEEEEDYGDDDDDEDCYVDDEEEEDDGESDDEALSADSSATSIINEVFLPDWSDSCLLIRPSLEPEEERNKIWSISFGYRQQIRWGPHSHHGYPFLNDIFRKKYKIKPARG